VNGAVCVQEDQLCIFAANDLQMYTIMNFYRVCGFTIESNVPLPELPHTNSRERLYVFQLLPGKESRPVPSGWFHHWLLPDGEVWLSFAKHDSGYLLRFPDLADFFISAGRKKVRCYPEPDIPLETIRHLFLDQIIPLLLSKPGKPVLHASAVSVPEGAIAFMGTTGTGKSTLTASFARQGFPVLTDDCLLLREKGGELFATPSYPGLRLWDDVTVALFEDERSMSQVAHYTCKKRLGLNNGRLRFCPNPVPLLRIYLLAPPEQAGYVNAISISPLRSPEAFIELVKYAFKLDITDRERLSEEFDYLSHMATLPLYYRLVFPRDLSLLPAVREAILENLSGK
jgi:hypothetical protein